jgi:8-oxo-dGTP pyrophosphatase MutT (NUDIX family)
MVFGRGAWTCAFSSQTKDTVINLSPSPNRIGRACVCILEGELMLMVSYADFFTFPGGGVNPGESFEEAATREAFEEAGARVKIVKFLFEDSEDQCKCYLAKLEHLEPSPEGRIVRWVTRSSNLGAKISRLNPRYRHSSCVVAYDLRWSFIRLENLFYASLVGIPHWVSADWRVYYRSGWNGAGMGSQPNCANQPRDTVFARFKVGSCGNECNFASDFQKTK